MELFDFDQQRKQFDKWLRNCQTGAVIVVHGPKGFGIEWVSRLLYGKLVEVLKVYQTHRPINVSADDLIENLDTFKGGIKRGIGIGSEGELPEEPRVVISSMRSQEFEGMIKNGGEASFPAFGEWVSRHNLFVFFFLKDELNEAALPEGCPWLRCLPPLGATQQAIEKWIDDLERGVAVQWREILPDGTEPDDLRAELEKEARLPDQADINPKTILCKIVDTIHKYQPQANILTNIKIDYWVTN